MDICYVAEKAPQMIDDSVHTKCAIWIMGTKIKATIMVRMRR